MVYKKSTMFGLDILVGMEETNTVAFTTSHEDMDDKKTVSLYDSITDLKMYSITISESCESIDAALQQINKNEKILETRPNNVTIQDIMESQELLVFNIGKLGVKQQPDVISIENETLLGTSLIVSTENIKEFIKTVIKKIKDVIKFILLKLKELVNIIIKKIKNIKQIQTKTKQAINNMSDEELKNKQYKLLMGAAEASSAHESFYNQAVNQLDLKVTMYAYEKLYNTDFTKGSKTINEFLDRRYKTIGDIVDANINANKKLLIDKDDIIRLQCVYDSNIATALGLDKKNIYIFLNKFAPDSGLISIYWDSEANELKSEEFSTVGLTCEYKHYVKKYDEKKYTFETKKEAINAYDGTVEGILSLENVSKTSTHISSAVAKHLERRANNLYDQKDTNDSQIEIETINQNIKTINTILHVTPGCMYNANKKEFNSLQRYFNAVVK